MTRNECLEARSKALAALKRFRALCDVMEIGDVRVVATAIPKTDHTPIVYPAAVIAGSAQAALGQRFIAFLLTPAAQALFHREGYTQP